MKNLYTQTVKFSFLLLLGMIISLGSQPITAQSFRPIDGKGVHASHPAWGSTYSAMVNLAPPSFTDGISTPSGQDRPNPRAISNAVFSQLEDVFDPAGRNDFVWVWGQFIDHDMTLSPDSEVPFNIDVPIGDHYFDRDGNGNVKINMLRSDYLPGSGTDITNPRKYYNAITAYLDASNVYGSDIDKANWLRSFRQGKMKTSKGNLLPFNTVTGEFEGAIDPNAPEMAMPFPFIKKFFVAGDVRANENPLLTSIQTLFVREHNRLCDQLIAENPNWTDQQLYLKARQIVGAEVQSITYQQFLGALELDLAPYSGYRDNINPQMANIFSTSAYRYGHSNVSSAIKLVEEDGTLRPNGIVYLRNAFFNPQVVFENGISAPLRGMSTQVQQMTDTKFIQDIRNFLFGPPGAGGLDLASININRGRDRGLPDFNTVRKALGLPIYTDFTQLTSDSKLVENLREVYKDINQVDSYVGFLAEKKSGTKMFGETMTTVLKYQFQSVRDGDPFFYEIDQALTTQEREIIANTTLTDIIRRNTNAYFLPENIFYAAPIYAEFRTVNGINNNLVNNTWGSTGEMQLRMTTVDFEDGISAPGGQNRPNPREISNRIFNQKGDIFDPLRLSDYNWVWGQFIDHDITLVLDDESESMNIKVPQCDQWMDVDCQGRALVPMLRSKALEGTGTDVNNPRQVPNDITAFLDASNIYGSEQNWANWLRTFRDGKLKTSAGNLLPFNTYSGEYDSPIDPSAPAMAMVYPNVTKYFVSGDVRANENPLLTSTHTLFMREHNRKCAELKALHPDWSDEQLYQMSRKWVGGLIQALAYEEWLPTLGLKLSEYKGYNPDVQPQIYNVFSAAAYRYGHSTINSTILRMEDDGSDMAEGNILLRDAFFNPNAIIEMNSIEPYLKGMSAQMEQDLDLKLIDDLRNFLFGPPGAGGLDLAAININRGRDRGLPDYNTVRENFGLEKVTSFSDITSNPEGRQLLAEVYGDVNNIDAYVGMLAEDHPSDALFGELVSVIVARQFEDIRDGDRFYFEIDPGLSKADVAEMKRTKFSDVIMRNTGLTTMQENVFFVDESLVATEEVHDVTALELNIFPNPASDYIAISASDNDQSEVYFRIYDVDGKMKKVISASLTNNENYVIDIKDLNPGVYLLQKWSSEQLVGQGKWIKP